jgi:hypothetical protein
MIVISGEGIGAAVCERLFPVAPARADEECGKDDEVSHDVSL